jgi:hypothetical protein
VASVPSVALGSAVVVVGQANRCISLQEAEIVLFTPAAFVIPLLTHYLAPVHKGRAAVMAAIGAPLIAFAAAPQCMWSQICVPPPGFFGFWTYECLDYPGPKYPDHWWPVGVLFGSLFGAALVQHMKGGPAQ